MSCPKGKHKWNGDGTRCTKCGDPRRPRGRPPGAKPKQKLVAGEAVAGKLAAALGTAAPPPAPPSEGEVPRPPGVATAEGAGKGAAAAQETAAAPAGPSASEMLWGRVGKKLTTVFIAGVEFAVEKLGSSKTHRREAGDCDDDDRADFEKNLGVCLGTWFPDTALSPGKALILSGGFIVGDICLSSTKIPRTAEERRALEAIAKPRPMPEAPAAPPAPTSGVSDADSTSAATNLPA